MTCHHGLDVFAFCYSCSLEARTDEALHPGGIHRSAANENAEDWGSCDHGVSLAPWMDCPACEVVPPPCCDPEGT